MFTLKDTFNNVTVSRHRTAKAALRAQFAHLRAVRRHNGQNSYLTYEILENGRPVDENMIIRLEADILRYL